MKYLQVTVSFFLITFFLNCTSIAYVNGRYTHVFAGIVGEEFIFNHQTNKFEYYSRTEGRVKYYSSGTWIETKSQLFINGFDERSVNVLEVESGLSDYPNADSDKIVIKYHDDPLDSFIKVDIVLNEDKGICVSGDTALFIDSRVRSVQLKSYLVHDGLLLSNPARIDTLYSAKIQVPGVVDKYKAISLKFNITQKDFYRIRLIDTLTKKNSRFLIWRKTALKKIHE